MSETPITVEELTLAAQQILTEGRGWVGGASAQVLTAVAGLAGLKYTLTVDPSIESNTVTEFKSIADAINSTPAASHVDLRLMADTETLTNIDMMMRYVDIAPHPDLGLVDGEYITLQGTTGASGSFGSGVKGFLGGVLRFNRILIKTGIHAAGKTIIGHSFFRSSDQPTNVLFRSCKIVIQHVVLFSVYIGRFCEIGTENGGSGTIFEHDDAITDGDHGALCAFNFSGAAASFGNFSLPDGIDHITHLCTGVLTDADGQAKNLVTNIPDWNP